VDYKGKFDGLSFSLDKSADKSKPVSMDKKFTPLDLSESSHESGSDPVDLGEYSVEIDED
jgi:hypothetical protein